LDPPAISALQKYTTAHSHGTIVSFEHLKSGIKNTFDYLKNSSHSIFVFPCLIKSFHIFLDDEQITHKDLAELAQKTQFLWIVGQPSDPYLTDLKALFRKTKAKHELKNVTIKGTKGIHGFIASVEKPRDLKIVTTDERVGVDLFVMVV